MIFYFSYLRHRHYHFTLHIFKLDCSNSSRFHNPPPLPFPPPSLFSCFRQLDRSTSSRFHYPTHLPFTLPSLFYCFLQLDRNTRSRFHYPPLLPFPPPSLFPCFTDVIFVVVVWIF